MFTSLSIQKFRCFEKLKFDQSLDRVNLILGTNSVGKTTLLEAIYLLIGMGNPDLTQRLSAFRGLSKFSGAPQQFSELFWEPLFHNLESNKEIKICGRRADGEHSVTLSIDRAPSTQVSLDNGKSDGKNVGSEAVTVFGDILKLSHTKPDDSTISANMMVAAREGGGAEMRIEPVPPDPDFSGFFIAASHSTSPEEDAARYTKLESVEEPTELIEALRVVEPRLDRVRVAAVAGTSMLRGDIGIGRMIPFPLLGGGLGRLAGILLSIADAPGGVVLVDEIENGFHHSVLNRVWEAIGRAASNYNTQVFATTHSFDCIEAAHEAFREDQQYAFRLHDWSEAKMRPM